MSMKIDFQQKSDPKKSALCHIAFNPIRQDPPLSKSTANFLWTGISNSTPDGFLS